MIKYNEAQTKVANNPSGAVMKLHNCLGHNSVITQRLFISFDSFDSADQTADARTAIKIRVQRRVESLTMSGLEELEEVEVAVEDSLVAGDQQNVLALSLLLSLALLTNLSAAPVILFRRTRFGNGQFACLILCLTMTDLVTTMSGLVGGLVLEVGHMSWVGSSQGCAAYYFISSWMLVRLSERPGSYTPLLH